MTQDEVRNIFDYRNGHLFWRGDTEEVPAGTVTAEGYRRIVVRRRPWFAHRLIWLYVHGECPRGLDHINGERDDNRIENLRLASGSQNQGNRRLNKNSGSGYRGVSFMRTCGKYRAQLGLKNANVYLGLFNTAEEAKDIYDKTAREWFGEYYRP